MQASTLVSLVFYLGAFVLYQATPKTVFTDPASVRLWVFIVVAMVGVIAGTSGPSR
jgi:DHA3 family multidrug efflux protein-like MFS transporter